ncbi:MAG: GntR family transcriptional regulator [Cyclobacteriaceae bacterium]|nr:GntR family transcriptional regulator [Cyclobacteriaceae bacterium]
MFAPIQISPASSTPKYLQISESIVGAIQSGLLPKGSKLPSINEICQDHRLARETVVKAFQKLKEKGLLESVHGKGFYVSSTNTQTANRIFLFFDTFTSYKETLYYGIKDAFGDNTFIDIYFHHFNFDVLKNTIARHIGNYTSYIILPMEHSKISQALKPIPVEKLFLVDINPRHYKQEFVGYYQDFEQDIKDTLAGIAHLISKYQSIKLIFRNTVTEVPQPLAAGFVAFCESNHIPYEVSYDKISPTSRHPEASPVVGHGYIVIDDDDLVSLVEYAQNNRLDVGKDIGIISYNDTPLKKVIGKGISVISTDFGQMGQGIANMIMNNDRKAIRNKTTFVNRGSF